MQQHCEYHPTKLSHWQCLFCHKSFCPSCIAVRESGYSGKEKKYFCPSCNRETEWIGAANTVVPFWERIHKFFLYPLSLQPLLLMSILAFLAVLVSEGGFIFGIIRFFIWAIMLKYAFAALRESARGNLKPPQVDSDTVASDFDLVYKQIGMFFLCFLAFFYGGIYLGPFGSLLILIAGILFLPAMIIVLVSTEKVFHSLNPMIFIPIATRIGPGYLVMFVFLTILFFAPYYLGGYIVAFMPEFSQAFLFNLAQNYYTLVSYHLMGYVLLQYHREIGYEVDYEDFADPDAEVSAEKIDPAQKALVEVGNMIKEGKHDEAVAHIEGLTRSGGFSDVRLSDRYFSLLKLTKAMQRLEEHAPAHLSLLVKAGEQEKACGVYEDLLNINENFLPEAVLLFKIAGWQNTLGKSREGIMTFKRFVKKFPDHHSAPMAYFRIAQILNDQIGDSEKSKRVLDTLTKRYPGHEIMSQVNVMRKQMTLD